MGIIWERELDLDQSKVKDSKQISGKGTTSTLRTKLGYQSGSFHDFKIMFETELTGVLSGETYNDSINGQTTYPLIADPENTEINQGWLSYAGIPDTEIKVGRQLITLDNQRFIGSASWRQNEQTFDSATITNTSLPNTKLVYGYISNVNRVFPARVR